MAQVTESELDSIVSGLSVEVETGADGQKRKLATYREMKDFFIAERDFWSQCTRPTRDVVYSSFATVVAQLLEAEQGDPNQARAAISKAVNRLRQARLELVYSESLAGKMLIMADKEGPDTAGGAIDYLRNQVSLQAKTQEYFDGVLWAALCLKTYILDSLAGIDRAAFDSVRGEMTDSLDKIRADHRRITGDVEAWKAMSENDFKGFLTSSRTRFDASHTEWKTTFDGFHKEAGEKLKALEELYLEKLRLDAPAKYWRDLQEGYKRAAGWWTFASGGLTLVVVGAIAWLLYYPPGVFQQKDMTPGTIKASILIAVGISMGAYLINLFVRMATSSVHLLRDARERLQLTHMFLSLVKEKAIEPKERDIVLTALFSRADTGLLKHDGTPAMASPLGQVIEAVKGK